MIQALIFDFDGLLVDTETPAFESWRELYTEYGHDLALELWQGALGTNYGFDAAAHLSQLVAQPIDRAALLARRLALKHALSAAQPLLPGAREILAQAHDLRLPCAVASSSSREWVVGWLRQHGIEDQFACIRAADDVQLTKPAPDLFLSAAACLGVLPEHCLVFEDSPNGILAARAAGMPCVLVPGAITRQLAQPDADLVLASLDAMPLAEIVSHSFGLAGDAR
ncbi:MAG TPA: HAD family hydrolase [Roseiflexaceae bacterium]|nr:HAD family hydrolase [Roseiflexaceae bacterium]